MDRIEITDRLYSVAESIRNVQKAIDITKEELEKYNLKQINEDIIQLKDSVKILLSEIFEKKIVEFKKLHPDAIEPKYYSEGAVAFDMHALITEGEEIIVPANSQKIISTGIAFSIPKNFELRISPRSGQSAKEQISIRNSPGIIDSDYTGPLMVIFVNNKNTDHVITKDQRICQVKLSRSYRALFENVDNIEETKRGEGRFGSTGGM